jgi:hypothetical protein
MPTARSKAAANIYFVWAVARTIYDLAPTCRPSRLEIRQDCFDEDPLGGNALGFGVAVLLALTRESVRQVVLN